MKEEKSIVKSERGLIKTGGEVVAAIRVRGLTGIRYDIKQTLQFLNLHRKNHCVLLEKKPSVIGMLIKVKDYVTWGEINPETAEMLKKRDEGKKFYRLNSPKKGFGRKGIKIPFGIGGALGHRGEKINDLIQRMI
jgi:large subunit ribosomal protein L30